LFKKDNNRKFVYENIFTNYENTLDNTEEFINYHLKSFLIYLEKNVDTHHPHTFGNLKDKILWLIYCASTFLKGTLTHKYIEIYEYEFKYPYIYKKQK